MTRYWTHTNRALAALMAFAVVAAGLLATVPVRAAPTSTAPAAAAPAQAFVPDYSGAPYNGTPITHGLGPTYGETWCADAAPGSSIANQQGAPLALIPYEAFGCLLAQFQAEAAAAGVPPRMTYSVNTLTDAGRTQWAVVVNAMETPQQVEAYNNWVAYRAKALIDPVGAQALLESYTNVKVPIFMENAIHGDEEEGADSMMQVIRDLVTLPRGTSATVDNFLDHAILITIPSMNPDGRFLGQRANQNGFDMNRDWLVQSQPEVRANLRLQVQWLAPVMLATHGYVNPTLVDGLTKPHNPGLEYDVFAYWNQRRLDANQAALARIGQGITRPVNGPVPVTVDKQSGITAATSSGTTATLTLNGAHGLTVGAAITVSGVGEAGYNGSFTVASIPTSTSLTYMTPGSDLPASSGGIVTGPFTTLARGFCASSSSPASNVCGTGTIAAAPGGLSEVGTTVTVTTTGIITAAPVKVADTVIIAGAGDPGYNGGPFRVTSVGVPTANSFTFESPNAGLAPSGGGTVQVQTGPNQAEGWDDLGPFYTQTYGAFWGVDGSTMEMCSSCSAPFTGRLGSKTAQYVGFWGSADFWIANRDQILKDQVKIFVRGVNDAPRPNCCDDPLVASRGFTEAEHDWMENYPKAYVIPVHGGGQRSDAEANRMAQWLLDNGIILRRATAAFTWNGTAYPAGSYVVMMNQPLRGLAFTALGPGLDYSVRISQLYAPPGGWSHGLMWGADTAEVPRGDATFAPSTEIITSVSALTGGVAAGPSDWYSLTTKGVREQQAVLQLLRDGVYGEIAEAAFISTSGGPMPAGTLIFPSDPNTVAALGAAGASAGITFQRNVAVPKPPTTRLSEAPKVGALVNNAFTNPSINDSIYSLRRIYGADTTIVSVLAGANSLQNSPTDPLMGIDVLYNTGQAFPAAGYTIATTGGATSSGTTATITTTANHNLTVGATVTISGVPVAGYNGTFTVTAIVSNTRFSYTTADSDLTASGAGSVTTQTRARLNAFFARGGGYIGTSQSANNLSFLTGAVPPLVAGSFTQASLSSFGGTAVWSNVGGSASPLTGAFPATDYLYLPSNVTYFSAIPTGSVIDGQYLADMGSAANPRGPTAGYVAGLWLNRNSTAALASNNAPVVIHGDTTAASRYTGLATNPFSRSDFERIWGWAVQSSLWGNLTDEALLDQTITADTLTDKVFGNPDFAFNATSSSGRSVAVTAAGQCTVSSPWAPTTIHLTAAGACTITASQPGDGNFNPAPNVEQTFIIAPALAALTYTGDTMAFTPVGKGAPTSAAVMLAATVIDSALLGGLAGSELGDIRTATITFSEGGTTLCGPLPVGLIGASLDTGSAGCSVSLGEGTHVIDIMAADNYGGTAQGTVTVIVAKGPKDTDIKKGDGKFVLGASAGSYAGDPGSEAKFKVEGKIEPKGPKGTFELNYTAGATSYRIDMTELAVLGTARQAGGTKCDKKPSATCYEAIYLRGTADLLDTSAKKPVTVGTGFTVQVAMTDRGKGKTDSIAVTLWDGSTLLFSSDWNGAMTTEQVLTGGNIGQP